MKWDSKVPMVPFNIKGDMLSYAFYKSEWKLFAPKRASLKIDQVVRGRSSATFVLKDNDGFAYPMFLTDLMYLLENHSVTYGRTPVLTWTAVKRGANFGIAVMRENDESGTA